MRVHLFRTHPAAERSQSELSCHVPCARSPGDARSRYAKGGDDPKLKA